MLSYSGTATPAALATEINIQMSSGMSSVI